MPVYHDTISAVDFVYEITVLVFQGPVNGIVQTLEQLRQRLAIFSNQHGKTSLIIGRGRSAFHRPNATDANFAVALYELIDLAQSCHAL